MCRQVQSGAHKRTVIDRPAGQPVCPPARRQSGVEQGQADRTCGIGLLNRRNFRRCFRAFDHHNRQMARVIGMAGFGGVLSVQIPLGRQIANQIAQTAQGGGIKDYKPPRLQLAVIGRARGGGQDFSQCGVVRHGAVQCFGRARSARQQKVERCLIAIRHWGSPLEAFGQNL